METLPDDILCVLLSRVKDPRGLGLTCRRVSTVYFAMWPLRDIYAGKSCSALTTAAPANAYQMFSTRELYVYGNIPALERAWLKSRMTAKRFLSTVSRIGSVALQRIIDGVSDSTMAEWLYIKFGHILRSFYPQFVVQIQYELVKCVIAKDRDYFVSVARKIVRDLFDEPFIMFKLCADILPNSALDVPPFRNYHPSILAYLSIRGIPVARRLVPVIQFRDLAALRLDDVIANLERFEPADSRARDRLDHIRSTFCM